MCCTCVNGVGDGMGKGRRSEGKENCYLVPNYISRLLHHFYMNETMPTKSGEIEAGNELETLRYTIFPQLDAFPN